MHDETKAIHIPSRRSNGSIAPPIELSTTFEHGPAGERLHGFECIREDNPNVSDLEARLAAIEGADGAVAFGSGMAAGAALLSRLAPGCFTKISILISASWRRISCRTGASNVKASI